MTVDNLLFISTLLMHYEFILLRVIYKSIISTVGGITDGMAKLCMFLSLHYGRTLDFTGKLFTFVLIMRVITLDGKHLTIEEIYEVAYNNARVKLSDESIEKIKNLRSKLDLHLQRRPHVKIYGLNTGCGDLKDTDLSIKVLEKFQENLIKSHSCGSGKGVPLPYVRAMMVLRLNAFARGHSGVSYELCKVLCDMLNNGVVPYVLEEGSVGASGDLVPLALIAATIIGLPEAQAYYQGNLMSSVEALKKAGIQPIKLKPKEALALINGTNLITAYASLDFIELENIFKHFLIASALSLEAIRGETRAFNKELFDLRPHYGSVFVADKIRYLVEGSKRMSEEARAVMFPYQSSESVGERIQDRYSFRAIPQVLGSAYEALMKLKETLNIEVNSVTDNPLFFEDEKGDFYALSGANFHGQPLAVVIDYVKLAFTSVGLISDKRSFSILNKCLNFGLPPNLAVNPSLGESGFMIAQYAGAARAAENRVLSTPASIMSISTSANQEDFVSMGALSAIHLHKMVHNLKVISAIELLIALRSLQISYEWLPEDLRKLGKNTQLIYEYLNSKFDTPSGDVFLQSYLEKMIEIINSQELPNIINL